MSRRIPQAFIDELMTRADLLDVIGSRIALKKAGSSYKGLCPFHDEKTPSFIVSPDKGIYKCFGCGAYGTAVGFLMDYENRSYPEAIEILADMLGLTVPQEHDEQRSSETEELFELLQEANQIFRRTLRDNKTAIEYLKRRGIDGETAARFAIGYAPDAWDTLLRELGRGDTAVQRLLQAGLIRENDQGRRFDYFRDRIMLPIRDRRGKVIGFGGRMLGSGEPKYLNSPETPVFHKGQALYGLYEARQRRPEQIIVVEGYLDVAALSQFGIETAVATLGTATTSDHMRNLTRLSGRVVFCFDGDRAGRSAAWRALETALPYGGSTVDLEFLMLPDGEDPDSLVRKRGAEAFTQLLGAATPLSNFLITELRAQVDLGSADGRSKLVDLARPLLTKLPSGVYRELLLTELADTAGMSRDRLANLLDTATPTSAPRLPPPPTEGKSTLVRKAITLLLHYPAAASSIGPVEGFDSVAQPGAGLLRELLEIARNDPQVTAAHLVERFRSDPEGRHLHRLLADVPLDGAEAAPDVLRDSLQRIVDSDRRRQTVEAVRNRPSLH